MLLTAQRHSRVLTNESFKNSSTPLRMSIGCVIDCNMKAVFGELA